MKNLFLLLGLIFTKQGHAQQSGWEIKLNNRIFLAIPVETEKALVKNISRVEWNKKGYLEIKYHNTEKNPWIRSFLLTDENEIEVYNAGNTSYVKLSLSRLRTLFRKKKEIRIYTIISPPDPLMGAPSRRLHLCTLRLP